MKKLRSGDAKLQEKVAVFLFQSSCFRLLGYWTWDLASEAIFCSDVIMALPDTFAGTKAIFHPDDLPALKEAMASGEIIAFIKFRIITTYGEVKSIIGENLTIEAIEVSEYWALPTPTNALAQAQEKKELEQLRQWQQTYAQVLSTKGIGVWYYLSSSGKMWMNDAAFVLHGMAPQSLNVHLRTFQSFLHPDEREAVIEFIDKAFLEKLPLHLDYRITVNGTEKWIRSQSQWFFTDKGEEVFGGTLQDVTESKQTEAELETWKALNRFQKQQLLFDEKAANIGHWQVNLLTRKTAFSDQFYRIFGIKPQSLPAHVEVFLHYIHPDDQEMVEAVYKKLIHEHTFPEIEYRIQRSDGKFRYVRQSGRIETMEGAPIMVGILEDITVQKSLKKRLEEASRQGNTTRLQWSQAEAMSGTGSWLLDITSKDITWSDGLFKLLGYKGVTMSMTVKAFWSFIHPHDLASFKSYWTAAVEREEESELTFRLLLRGAIRYIKALFRIQSLNEQKFFVGILQDITAEQVLQERLQQRVQLMESLTGNMLDKVMITDENNTVVLWNAACEKAYGIKQEEAIGQNFFDLFPSLNSEQEMGAFLQALKGEKVFEQGKKSTYASGFYDLHLLPIRKDKKTTGILHIIRDVTSEVELRRSLEERLQFTQSLVESSIDRIIALDRNLNYQYWNRSAEVYYGVSKGEVLGKNILDVFPQMVNDPTYGELRKAMRGEVVYIPADASASKFFETYLVPVKNGRGEANAVLWIAHDLRKELHLQQEKQEADKQLKEQAHYLRRITDTVPDIMSVMDLETKKYTFLNSHIVASNGFDPKVLSGKERTDLQQFVHPEDRATLSNYFAAFATAGDEDVITTEYRAGTNAKEWQWFLTRGKVFQRNGEGKVSHILNVIQNITERKTNEEQLAQSQHWLKQTAYATPSTLR